MSPYTQNPSPAADRSLLSALDRMGGYLLSFATVFAVFVWASVLFVLPQYTRIDVLGSSYDVDTLPALKADLQTQISAAELRRNALVQPVQDELYEELKNERATQSMDDLLAEIGRIDKQVGGSKDAVHISSTIADLSAHTLIISGDIRSVGMQSMTVLAEFLDALSHIPAVASMQPSPFLRRADPDIGAYSPFTVTLTLR